MEKEYLVRIR